MKSYLKYSSDWVAEIPAILTFALGIINIVSAVGRPLPDRITAIRAVFSINILVFSRGFVLATGFILIILSYQLTQRSRNAWFVSVGLISASVLAHLVKGFDFEEAFFASLVLIILILTRKEYKIRHRFQNYRNSLKNLGVVAGGAFIFGIVGFYFLDQRYFGQSFYLADTLNHWSRLFFGLSDSGLSPTGRFGYVFMRAISITGIFTALYAFYSLFRPAYYFSSERPITLAKLQLLLNQAGVDSMDYFKRANDKDLFLSKNEKGAISYKQSGRYAIVLSDPIGTNVSEVKKTIAEFLKFTAENGLQTAFVQTTASYLDIYKSFEFSYLQMGEEAFLNLADFSLEGPRGKEARYYLNRFEKEGYKFNRYAELKSGDIQKLKQVNDEWLTLPHYTEHAFTEGHFEVSNLESETVYTVEDSGGAIIAFASIVEYPKQGLTLLDLMRRRVEIPNGAMDFLIYQLELEYQKKGFSHFSLSLAPLSGIPEKSTLPEKTMKFFYQNIKKIYSFSGLRKFKEKFQPEWQPRYLVYQSTISLPFLLYAIIRATSLSKRTKS